MFRQESHFPWFVTFYKYGTIILKLRSAAGTMKIPTTTVVATFIFVCCCFCVCLVVCDGRSYSLQSGPSLEEHHTIGSPKPGPCRWYSSRTVVVSCTRTHSTTHLLRIGFVYRICNRWQGCRKQQATSRRTISSPTPVSGRHELSSAFRGLCALCVGEIGRRSESIVVVCNRLVVMSSSSTFR